MATTRIRAGIFAAALALATGLSVAQDKSRDQTRDQTGAQTRERGIYGYQLMTPEERDEFRARVRAAKTYEERERIRAEHHEQMQARAKERGLTLPPEPRRDRGPGRGPGHGPGGSAGKSAEN
jgi:hypothetical protein